LLNRGKFHTIKKAARQIYFSMGLTGPGVMGLTLTSVLRFEPLVEEKLMA
jgi:hypothetical protein